MADDAPDSAGFKALLARLRSVRGFDTDVDEPALHEARQGTYTARSVEPLPAEWCERYFTRAGDRYAFRTDLRRAVIFGRHDLIQDAPISHVDLLVCRNVLIYFNAETQNRILTRFHFALENNGILFLGKAEMLVAHANWFRPVMNEELQSSNEELQTLNDELNQRTGELNRANAFLDSILGGLRAAVVVVDDQLAVQVWSRHAKDLWGLRADEVHNRRFTDLDIGLPAAPVRDLVHACMADGATQPDLVLEAINRRGKPIRCRIAYTPRLSPDGQRMGAILLMEEA